jgi:hypothetical protein
LRTFSHGEFFKVPASKLSGGGVRFLGKFVDAGHWLGISLGRIMYHEGAFWGAGQVCMTKGPEVARRLFCFFLERKPVERVSAKPNLLSRIELVSR